MSTAPKKDSGYEREFVLSNDQFAFISQFVYDQVGIKLPPQKRDMVYSRLVRRLRKLSLDSFSEYCALIGSPQGESEIGNLINAITTNTTSFFREGHHFEHLAKDVLAPLLRSHPPEKRLRLWSAACSAGMETYSMAMVLHKVFGAQLHQWDAKILATDIDTGILDIARKGNYADEQFGKIPDVFRKAYVDRDEDNDSIQMKDSVRRLISFKKLNLLHDWPMQGLFDVIFCRNVVIYFDKPTQKKLFAKIAAKLKPGGILYIGHSENLFGVSDDFISLGKTIYKRKEP